MSARDALIEALSWAFHGSKSLPTAVVDALDAYLDSREARSGVCLCYSDGVTTLKSPECPIHALDSSRQEEAAPHIATAFTDPAIGGGSVASPASPAPLAVTEREEVLELLVSAESDLSWARHRANWSAEEQATQDKTLSALRKMQRRLSTPPPPASVEPAGAERETRDIPAEVALWLEVQAKGDSWDDSFKTWAREGAAAIRALRAHATAGETK